MWQGTIHKCYATCSGSPPFESTVTVPLVCVWGLISRRTNDPCESLLIRFHDNSESHSEIKVACVCVCMHACMCVFLYGGWWRYEWESLRHRKKSRKRVCCVGSTETLTIQTVVLLVAAFAQDGWGAVVEDGCGFDGCQAAHGNGGSSWRI